ncbi:hypothetical protein PIB30_027145 [Stylosanthes scabra]|uniref:Uncharacterized protein n=1 Tax=Stylosanthes scabra TaxID=79078 RepID=A0ABU6YB60_9FABA|nr:hypothetical protein [Stylosanthes scabra]
MGSGVIYYDIEKREKYEDSDERADSDLAVMKTRRYHFDEEPFIHPLHSACFDSDRSYELPIESLLARLFKRERSLSAKIQSIKKGKSDTACEDDDVEVNGVNNEEVEKDEGANGIEEEGKKEEEVEEEKEDPEEHPSEEEMPVVPRSMDVDADEDYLQYLEELRHHPKYSPIHNSQVFAQNPSEVSPALIYSAFGHLQGSSQ